MDWSSEHAKKSNSKAEVTHRFGLCSHFSCCFCGVIWPNVVSRGDEHTRLITLRNLTWTPVTYNIELDETIGLKPNGSVNLRQLHPTEQILDRFQPGQKAAIKVLPFRSCLILASTERMEEIGIKGCEYEVVRDTPGRDTIVKLLGYPGSEL